MSMFDDKIRQDAGIPLLFGERVGFGPGRVFYVNPTNGSDNNTGLKMEQPVKTIAKAYTLVTSNNHDAIVLSANAALAESDELAVTKNRVHFIGLDAVGRYLGQRSRWTMGVTTGTAIAVVQNTGVGNSFQRIKFDSSDTTTTSVYAFAEGGEYTVIENCEIVEHGDLATATAADLLMNGDSAYVKGCYIGSTAYEVTAARTNVLFTRETISGKVARDVIFEDCILGLKSTDNSASHMYMPGATDIERFLIVKNSIFYHAVLGSATVAAAIRVGSAQTEGHVLVYASPHFNSTALSTANLNVFY